MEELRDKVSAYYLARFEELSTDKQFHFASRLYLWSGNPECLARLEKLRAEFTANDSPTGAFQEIVRRTQAEVLHGSKNAAELRQPYFKAYPRLKTYVSLLFRLVFLKTVYGIDAKAELLAIVSNQELAEYQARLLQDPAALAILSTHAINFLYLYNRVLLADDSSFDPSPILSDAITEQYDFSKLVHIQLYIYLYTHCIIGESQFYARHLPDQYLATYQTMLARLEQLIEEHYDDINLDNKFEYLVCCAQLGVKSPLKQRIEAEAEKSISEDGSFLIDRHNNNPQLANNTLDLSEHRNVLYILANLPFSPAGA